MNKKNLFTYDFSITPAIDAVLTRRKEQTDSQWIDHLLRELESVPELSAGNVTNDLLETHRGIVDGFLSLFLSPFSDNSIISAVTRPFEFEAVSAQKEYQKLEEAYRKRKTRKTYNDEHLNRIDDPRFAFALILNRVYNVVSECDFDLVLNVASHEESELEKVYRISVDTRYCNIVSPKAPQKSEVLGKELLQLLSEKNTEKLRKIINPTHFHFSGFFIVNAVEVSRSQFIARSRELLLAKNTLINFKSFRDLNRAIRNILQIADTDLHIFAFKRKNLYIFSSLLSNYDDAATIDSVRHPGNIVINSFLQDVMTSGSYRIIGDLQEKNGGAPVEELLLENNVRSILAEPLLSGKRSFTGVVCVSSGTPGLLSEASHKNILSVLNSIANSVDQELEAYDHQVREIIDSNCTVIHPSVAWKFEETAEHYIYDRKTHADATLAPIEFKDVYPLYGATDIRGSSDLRVEATRQDIIEQITMAISILSLAREKERAPLLDKLLYRTSSFLEGINGSMTNADETAILGYLKTRVETSFDHLASLSSELKEKIDRYKELLHPANRVFYHHRKDFDESVTMINRVINSYFNCVQPEIQGIYPHYFDKRTTDGVDHTIYIGDSIKEEKDFSIFFLKNMRLWQLILMCRIASLTDEVKEELTIPLDTTQLIVVQNMPISIRFSYEEKRFKIEGSYNIRYEIMKKRIDKIQIKRTEERLTQPGKIAIVYTKPAEEREYLEYINYLQHQHYIKEDEEILELEDQQGAYGLKALRVEVNIDKKDMLTEKTMTDLLKNKFSDLESILGKQCERHGVSP